MQSGFKVSVSLSKYHKRIHITVITRVPLTRFLSGSWNSPMPLIDDSPSKGSNPPAPPTPYTIAPLDEVHEA